MLPIIQLGPLSLQAPGLFLLISLWIGITLAEKNSPHYKLSADRVSSLIMLALVAGVLGGRIAYIAQNPAAFAGNLGSMVSLNPGLFDITGALAAALIGAVVYGQRKSLPLLPTLDALIPFFGMLAIGYGLMNFASGNAFGMETNQPWAIDLWGAKRHPSQIYEVLAAFVTFNLLYPPKADAKSPGLSFATFVAITAGYRLFIEAFRGDSRLIFGGLRTGQLSMFIVLAAALWGIDKLRSTREAE
jgi:phosphatidylglycerol:prolipoprotein diacylglycerol transferase